MSDVALLPPNATATERALERPTERIDAIPVPVRHLWNPDLCPTAFLPWLAWALSVDEWDPAWTEESKREVIRATVAVHRRKGTVAAVRGALDAAGYGDAELVERFGWDDYDGASLHGGAIIYAERDHWAEYRVILKRPITTTQAAGVRSILEAVAPVRSHLKALDFTEALNLYNDTIRYDGSFTHGVA